MSTNGVKMQSFSGSNPGGVSPEKPGVGREERGGFLPSWLTDGRAGGDPLHPWCRGESLGAARGGRRSAVPIAHLGARGSARPPRLSRTEVQRRGRFDPFPCVFCIYFCFFFNSSHPALKRGQLPVAGRAHSGLEEEEEEEGLAWQARRPAPSHCLPRRRRGHVGERGEAGEGTRRRLGGENGRPRQMLRSGQAQSSQLCPPLLSGVPSEEQRRRGAAVPCCAVLCRAGEAGRQSGTGRGGLAVLLWRAARRFVRSGCRVLGTSEAFLFS